MSLSSSTLFCTKSQGKIRNLFERSLYPPCCSQLLWLLLAACPPGTLAFSSSGPGQCCFLTENLQACRPPTAALWFWPCAWLQPPHPSSSFCFSVTSPENTSDAHPQTLRCPCQCLSHSHSLWFFFTPSVLFRELFIIHHHILLFTGYVSNGWEAQRTEALCLAQPLRY